MSFLSRSSTPGVGGPLLAAALTLVALNPAPARAGDDGMPGPEDVRAYVFSRDNGHYRHTDGDDDDRDEAREAQRGLGTSLWLRRSDGRYLITDEKLLDRAVTIFEPQEELGQRQGELGRRQGELGRLQGELGRMQGQVGRVQSSLAMKRARLATYQYERTDEYEADRAEVRAKQLELGTLQRELGEMQRSLGRKQGELGRLQGELGRQQAQLARDVRRELGELLRDAIASGKAKRL